MFIIIIRDFRKSQSDAAENIDKNRRAMTAYN